MIYVSVEKLSKNYPEQPLFDDLTFGIFKGERIALIANNGAGKSSLIKILTGKDVPDAGMVHVQEDIRVGVLEQDPHFPKGFTIQQIIDETHHDFRSLIAEYERILASQDGSEEMGEELARVSARMEDLQAWDYDRKLKSYLTRFDITNLQQVASELSGGQRKRVAIAIALSTNPHLLILDEPTNHLDIEMIEWLESYLAASSTTLFMVTHDRYFLDKVCNHILELHNGKLYKHNGNYAYFLEKKAEREAVFDREIDKANNLLKQELEWMRRMPQARSTKAKSRIDAFYNLEDKANSRVKSQSLSLEVKMQRVGGKIIELKNVQKAYGDDVILDRFSYNFKKGDRVGIVGPNGAGKTTLLNMITGKLDPDSGHVNRGDTVAFGYYTQSGIVWKDDERVIDFIKEIAEYITLADGTKLSASQFLQHFLFAPEVQYKPIEKLSGGEKRRLHLLTVLIKNPNFLILDEPTNDLDLLTLNKLEEFLVGFGGVLIVVSHDRYFIDKLVDHLFIFEGNGKIKDYNGSYSEYRILKSSEQKSVDKPKPSVGPAQAAKNKPSNREKNELRKLEREIESMEDNKKRIEEELTGPSLQIEEITRLSEEIGALVKDIESKTERWMELAEKF
ncbi:UNVERIFIED_CONTAM: hypothetical protein GTU68_028350 [Idotea baltica]|nr:hypothetical protein [Idotea baltica]